MKKTLLHSVKQTNVADWLVNYSESYIREVVEYKKL